MPCITPEPAAMVTVTSPAVGMPPSGGCLRQPLLAKARQNGRAVGGKHIPDLEALDEGTCNGKACNLAKLSQMIPRKDLWRQALVAVICISVGVMHPLATEQAKSGLIYTCQRSPGDPGLLCSQNDATDSPELTVRKGMPFHKATLTVVSQSTAVVTSGLVTVWIFGSAGVAKLRDGGALVRMGPVGFLYGFGDFLQTVACNVASAPVVLVMGQSKLMMTALFSAVVLGTNQETDWHRLAIISCAAAASTDISAGSAVNTLMQWNEVRGGMLALLKASLSSAGAVLSERDYKKESDSFWVLSFRVQLLMLTASLLIMPWTCANWDYTSPAEFFGGGSDSMCLPSSEMRCIVPTGETTCSCIDRMGWDRWTALAAFAIVMNGFVTGLVLKYLSAVTKSVCGALSTGVFYVSYVCLGYRPFNVAQANVLAIVVLSSYEYAMARHRRRNSKAASLK